jgi:hypothetical protein
MSQPHATERVRAHWCHHGSPASRVTDVEVAWEEVRGESVFRLTV